MVTPVTAAVNTDEGDTEQCATPAEAIPLVSTTSHL